MLTKQMKLAMVLTAAMGTSALAQDATVVETPDGNTAVVPAEATEISPTAPVSTVVISDYPVFSQDMNDESIIEMLVGQGFEDIHILREGSLMTVTATREGDDIKLVYNLVEGRLIEVNGERVLTEEEKALSEENPQAAMGEQEKVRDASEEFEDDVLGQDPEPGEAGENEGVDDGATEEPAEDATDGTDATDGATDDSATDDSATDDSATDGSTDDSSTDGSTDDSGTDSPDGGDSETNG